MSFFTQAAPKMRQEGFAPPASPGPASSPPSFDAANMFFGHHIFPSGQQQHQHQQQQQPEPPRVDFGDELVAMLSQRPSSPHPPHNPFDTNTTGAAGTATYRHPPHNIFDVGAHNTTHHGHGQHHQASSSFPTHFSLPDYTHGAFPERRRSRSRSKPPPSAPQHRKRASISSTSPGRPHAILIPPPGSPLALHISQTAPSAWFAPADSPFSLPTPDSHFGASPSAKDSPPPPGGAGGDKQAQLASEKRRRRRESHNAVERRRRDNINEKISELATLIPECMLDPSGGAPDTPLDFTAPPLTAHGDGEEHKPASPSSSSANAVKANKGMILRKSVEYIRYLQQLVNAQASRNRELEARLAGGGEGGGGGMEVNDVGAEGMVVLGDSPPEAEVNGEVGGGEEEEGVRVKEEDGDEEEEEGDGDEEGTSEGRMEE